MADRAVEQALVDRLRAGDETVMRELSVTYGSKIYRLALRYMCNHEDAEEIRQDVLLRVFRKIDLFRGDAALASWIYRITFNTAMSRLRSARVRRAREVTEADRPQPGADAHDAGPARDIADWSTLADDELYRGELRRRLVGALTGLPPIYRTPVLLRDVRGLSTDEASSVLGVKPQTLKSRLHRGRLVLRERLGEFAGGLTLHPAT